jgi:hypothetical protein
MAYTRPPELIGVSDVTLQAWLTATQGAIQALTTGGQVQTAAYTQGDGAKSVTYTRADLPGLRIRAQMLAQALGLVERRRPMRPYFG